MVSIEECLSVWRILKVLDLTGNPVFNAYKYRDRCIISSSSLGFYNFYLQFLTI